MSTVSEATVDLPGSASDLARSTSDLAVGLLARCRFPSPSAVPVYLAVSGGADSLALLILAARAGLTAVVIHVDHGLRAGSAHEADVVAAAAAAHGFEFVARSVMVTPGADLEARARRARYSVLPPGVLTGHTMDDQAETVLINMLRGAGLDGMCGMRDGNSVPPAGGGERVRRPLLALRRQETSDLCRLSGWLPVTDPTNADPRFVRNRVRSEVLPLLCDVAGRDIVPVLHRQAELFQTEREYLDAASGVLDSSDARALSSAPTPLARRALRAWLRNPSTGADLEGHPPTAADIERVLAVVRNDATACEISGGRRIARSRGRLRITTSSAQPSTGDT